MCYLAYADDADSDETYRHRLVDQQELEDKGDGVRDQLQAPQQ